MRVWRAGFRAVCARACTCIHRCARYMNGRVLLLHCFTASLSLHPTPQSLQFILSCYPLCRCQGKGPKLKDLHIGIPKNFRRINSGSNSPSPPPSPPSSSQTAASQAAAAAVPRTLARQLSEEVLLRPASPLSVSRSVHKQANRVSYQQMMADPDVFSHLPRVVSLAGVPSPSTSTHLTVDPQVPRRGFIYASSQLTNGVTVNR